jgi:hypothetical protein
MLRSWKRLFERLQPSKLPELKLLVRPKNIQVRRMLHACTAGFGFRTAN